MSKPEKALNDARKRLGTEGKLKYVILLHSIGFIGIAAVLFYLDAGSPTIKLLPAAFIYICLLFGLYLNSLVKINRLIQYIDAGTEKPREKVAQPDTGSFGIGRYLADREKAGRN